MIAKDSGLEIRSQPKPLRNPACAVTALRISGTSAVAVRSTATTAARPTTRHRRRTRPTTTPTAHRASGTASVCTSHVSALSVNAAAVDHGTGPVQSAR